MSDRDRGNEPMDRTNGPGEGSPACRRTARALERLIDGDPDVVEMADASPDTASEIEALKAHLDTCKTCRDLYALDLALIESIKTAPETAFESVAAEVVGTVRARERRSLIVRWVPVVGVASWVGMVAVLYGRGILERLIGLMTGGFQSRALLEGLSRAAGAAVKILGIARAVTFETLFKSDAMAYAPGLAMGILMAGAVVLIMMYGMGIWLGKPREVRSWHRS
jgi:predicted anti-sigma-YlaC factor YlaD